MTFQIFESDLVLGAVPVYASEPLTNISDADLESTKTIDQRPKRFSLQQFLPLRYVAFSTLLEIIS